ncbi:MAG: serpin family protein [Acidimicrobiia bacterium]|nr:serpin family protein [Acidimicrobiia bacterium]
MKRILALSIAAAMLATACGDDPAPADQTTTTESTATTATTATPPEEARQVPGELTVSPAVERAAPDAAAPTTELAAGFNAAGFELWLTQDATGNFVFSPMSIAHALLMARGAADDATGSAIDAALGLPNDPHAAWNAIDQMMEAAAAAEDELTVTLADRIWPRLDVTPDQAWVDLLAAQHGASVQPLDFAGDASGSRDIINEWVSEQTQELIPELLPAGFIKGNTVLVLTDAVYFEARWDTVFGKYGPESGEFIRLDGSKVPVEFMKELELSSPRGTGDGYVFAEIPYVGDEFSMLVVVPDEGQFDEVRNRLGREFLAEVDAAGTVGPFELQIPKWTDDTALDLLPWLTDIGAAPGSYPAISPDAFLGAAVHGADIAVDEQGTVAAAATALGFLESGPPEPELTVKADKPFLYVIRHVPTGLVLFAGQVTDPTS